MADMFNKLHIMENRTKRKPALLGFWYSIIWSYWQINGFGTPFIVVGYSILWSYDLPHMIT
jgi:hypothetical protein